MFMELKTKFLLLFLIIISLGVLSLTLTTTNNKINGNYQVILKNEAGISYSPKDRTEYISEFLATSCDVVISRDKNSLANIYCLDDDCSDEIKSAISYLDIRGGGTICIRNGDYPIASENDIKFNNAKYIAIIGFGNVRFYATKRGITLFAIGPLDETKTVKYVIKNIFFDMNNLARVGLLLINGENSIIEDIIIANRLGNPNYWMFSIWCRRAEILQTKDSLCKNNVIRNVIIENSTTTSWEAFTLTYTENTIVENLYCKNVTFYCAIDYQAIKTYWKNIRDIGKNNDLHPWFIINTETYDQIIENVYAPYSILQIGYAYSPFTNNTIIIRDVKVRAIRNWPNSGICIPGVGERPFWCDQYGPYIAYPKILVDDAETYSDGESISFRVGCYNSTLGISYPDTIVIKDSIIRNGWKNVLHGRVIILAYNIFENVSSNAKGFWAVYSFMGQKVYVKDNLAFGQYPINAYFFIEEENPHRCESGERIIINPIKLFGTNMTIVFEGNYGNIGTRQLYAYLYNERVYTTPKTNYVEVKTYKNYIDLWK